MTRLDWIPILQSAADIVTGYDGGVTLRQLFYRLVSKSIIPNSNSAYKTLSSKTAHARRTGWFPPLVDHTRSIGEYRSWTSPREAMESMMGWYRRPRTEGQKYALYLGAEKATMQTLLDRWFGDLGIPVILLRGYGSQSYLDQIRVHAERDGRSPILIYSGDLDPSGEDIERDFLERVENGWQLEHVAVRYEQIDDFELTKQPGKRTDSRAPAFMAKYGELFQVEVEAIEPNTLRELYQDALDRYWDKSAHRAALQHEMDDREQLQGVLDEWVE